LDADERSRVSLQKNESSRATSRHLFVMLSPSTADPYTSIALGLRCKDTGIRPSMGMGGDAYVRAARARPELVLASKAAS
jgi:hypothetical protein